MRISFWLWKAGGEEERWSASWSEALRERMPSWETSQRILLVDGVNQGWRSVLQRGVERVLGWLPGVWSFLQEQERWLGRKSPLDFLKAVYPLSRIESFLEEEKPDVLVAFHPLALAPLAYLKREGQISVPIIAAVPDFSLGEAWIQPSVSRYVLCHPSLEEQLAKAGFLREKARIMGLPLDVKAKQQTREEACRDLGFDPAEQWGLVDLSGGGDWTALCFQLSVATPSLQWLVYAGPDVAEQERLRQVARKTGLRARMLGEAAPWGTLFDALDLCVTSPKLPRLWQALRHEVPLFLLEGAGKEEAESAAFLWRHQLAAKVSVDQLAVQLDEALLQGQLRQMKEAMGSAFSKKTREDWVAFLVEVAMNREKVLERDRALSQGEDEALRGSLDASTEIIVDPRRLLGEGAESAPSWFEEIGGEEERPKTSGGSLQDELAEIILREKRMLKSFDQLQEQIDVWMERVELAEKRGDIALQHEAEQRLQKAERDIRPIERALQQIHRQKARLLEGGMVQDGPSSAADDEGRRGGAHDPWEKNALPKQHKGSSLSASAKEDELEGRFRDVALDQQLHSLKQRIKIQKRDMKDLKDEEF
ncbi:MAG: hypothetical protein H6727_08670 [Myxococcales bacterium]|nr:hypothetical protein [Myxococcales bacterium]